MCNKELAFSSLRRHISRFHPEGKTIKLFYLQSPVEIDKEWEMIRIMAIKPKNGFYYFI
jgi:hypothetical protein